MTTTKFRPSNGTEGECFIEAFCYHCQRSPHLQSPDDATAEVGCVLVGLTMLHDIEHPDYPAEWVCDEAEGARCTAFVIEGDPVPALRCQRTLDMFEDAR